MSEADLVKPEQQSPASEAVVPPTGKPAARGNGLALLALLIGAAGAGVGGWSLWQLHAIEARDQQQQSLVQDAQGRAQSLEQSDKRLAERIDRLPTPEELDERRRLLANLQNDQQRLSQRVESVLSASRKDWRLAEAEHLLRLASLRLSALQDITSAKALVEAADDILREQDDPAAFGAREQLSRSLEALRTTPQPDRTGLFLQLGALREQAASLQPLAPAFEDKGGVLRNMAAEGDGGSWWGEWLEKLSHYFRIQFDADQNIKPLLSGQGLSQVRLALSLALEQAQWAALHGQTQVYQQALKQARDVLDTQFNDENPESRALMARLGELAEQPVEVITPDLAPALEAVQAYLARGQRIAEPKGQAKAPAQAEPAAGQDLEDTPAAEGQGQ